MEALTTWVALAGALWSLFAIAEHAVPPATRRQISDWLSGQSRASSWSTTFVAMCDGVFHTPRLTEKSFWRVSLASHLSAMLLMCFVGVVYPGASVVLMLLMFLYAPLLIGSLALVNLVPGYLALLITRALVSWLSHQRLPGRFAVWLLAHCLSTCIVAVLGCILSFVVMRGWSHAHALRGPTVWLSGYVDYVLASDNTKSPIVLDILRLQPVVVPGVIFPSFGIWFYAPCFATIYLWLYVLSGLLIRWVSAWHSAAPPGLGPPYWDIHERPLQALGSVATIVGSMVYWSVILVNSI